MRRPGVFASGRIDVAENVLVRVRSESGLCGQAEAQARPYTYGGGQESIVAAVRDELGPRLIGHSALRTESLYELAAVPGADRVARGALDVAVWDLAGLLLGQPTQRLLGGYATERRRRAHGLARRPGRHGRGGARGARALRRHDLQGQGGP